MTATVPLAVDARNRALRTALQGLGIDVAVTLALALYTQMGTLDAWGQVQWSVVGFTLSKTVLMTVVSFVMRKYMDPSAIPTPLPPVYGRHTAG